MEWTEGAEWIMTPERDTESTKPVRGFGGWGQAIADICIRQWGTQPETLIPLLEELEEK